MLPPNRSRNTYTYVRHVPHEGKRKGAFCPLQRSRVAVSIFPSNPLRAYACKYLFVFRPGRVGFVFLQCVCVCRSVMLRFFFFFFAAV